MRRVAVLVMLTGCSFSHGSLSGDDSTPPGEAGPRDGTIDALGLVDDGLLVRYFIDEAASGQTPIRIEDSAPTPLTLVLTYTNAFSFTEPAPDHRALRWTAPSDVGRASAPIDGTKISSMLDPAKTFTLELVTELRGNGAGENRFISVANGTSTYGSVALITSDLVSLRLHLGTATVYWSVPFAQGRLVLTCVVDTTQATATDRAKLYINGAPATRTGGTSPSQGYDPPILLSDYLAIGNVEGAGRSPEGDIFYAAIYTTALSPAQVMTNAQRLMANDDR
jgi:hypothetical protein